MRKIALIIFLGFSTLYNANAQYVELGLFGGASFYNGDLSHQLIYWNEFHPAAGIYAGVHFNRYFSLSVQSKFGTISGHDSNSDEEGFKRRNLSFESNIIEAGIVGEFYFPGYIPGDMRFSPFISLGINWFHFNPTAEYMGSVYDLQPLGTEGQGTSAFPDREPYALNQISIPFGVGVKYNLSYNWNLAFEVTFRKTFTDYLDDLSKTYVDADILTNENGELAYALSNRTGEYLGSANADFGNDQKRGSSSVTDYYIFTGFTISYNLIGVGKNSASRQVDCPGEPSKKQKSGLWDKKMMK
ncbi:MAG: outer membrane beta-barrel protein [Bacteroidetes bacterium]|nr:outer membrane beta-barrel protein [Bacteroidota bacterium]